MKTIALVAHACIMNKKNRGTFSDSAIFILFRI